MDASSTASLLSFPVSAPMLAQRNVEQDVVISKILSFSQANGHLCANLSGGSLLAVRLCAPLLSG